MLTTLLTRIKQALRNDVCSYCRYQPTVANQLICADCHVKLDIRDGIPLVNTDTLKVHAAALFTPRLKRLIYPYKFYNRHEYAETLASILSHYWASVPASDKFQQNIAKNKNRVVAVPVPSRWQHHHLEPVLRRFCDDQGYELMLDGLVWQRETQPQHRLSGKRSRMENVQGSMSVHPRLSERLTDRQSQSSAQVLLLDDITTTGATLIEASRALTEGCGFQPVCLTLCQVPLPLHRQMGGS